MSSPAGTDQDLLAIVLRQERLVAQELHDTICQSLAGISLLVQVASRARKAGREVPLSDLVTIGSRLGAAIDQSRIFLQSQLIENQPECLPQALQHLAVLAPSTVRFSLVNKGELEIRDRTVAQVLYRISRESLQNIAREANSTRVCLALQQRSAGLELKISHNGERYNKAGACILSGDGMLERMSRAVGLGWQIRATKSTVVLTCGPKIGSRGSREARG